MSFLSAINETRLRLAEVLERNGVKLGEDVMQIQREAIATRRCVFCNAKPQCDAWLARGTSEGFDAFCPNAEFIAQRSTPQGG